MTDLMPPPLPVSETAPKRSPKLWWIILLCLLGVVLLAGGTFGIYRLVSTRMPVAQDDHALVQKTLDKFMQAMVKRDIDSAYAMLSSDGQKQASRAKLQQMAQGANSAIFENYQSTEIVQLSVSQSFDSTQGQNQHTEQASVAGYFHYSDGVKRRFTAALLKEGSVWKLDAFSVDGRPIQEQQLQGPIS